MTGAAASLPKTRVWGFDIPDPSTASGEPPVLAAFRIWPGAGVTTTTRRAVPDYMRARYYDPSTGQFISRDPAVAQTRQPYAYVNDNPLNGSDPSGLMCLEFWDTSKCNNPISGAINWLNAPRDLPNPDLITGPANILYGAKKLMTVPDLIVGGTLADFTVVGVPFGLIAYGAAGYQAVTGTARVGRGIGQTVEGIKHPCVHESVLSWADEAALNVVPFGGAVDIVGGLP